MKYIVPEYYSQFQCKGGKCRRSCCDGWPIRITKNEYYHLLGTHCSQKLRKRLDIALKTCSTPNSASSALIATDWRGNCMLHGENGLCALQTELGETALPQVCRLFPRKMKTSETVNFCCCSGSCEEVVELLFRVIKPLQFEEIDLSSKAEIEFDFSTSQYNICTNSISIMQNRNYSLAERFIFLGNYLNIDNFYTANNHDTIYSLQILTQLCECYNESNSISQYIKVSLNHLGIHGVDLNSTSNLSILMQTYHSSSDHINTILPTWQVLIEQLIINHMFYHSFPFEDDLGGIEAAFISLIGVYSFLRFNMLGYYAEHDNADGLIDFFSSMFRVIDHSNFKNVAVSLIRNGNPDIIKRLIDLIYF